MSRIPLMCVLLLSACGPNGSTPGDGRLRVTLGAVRGGGELDVQDTGVVELGSDNGLIEVLVRVSRVVVRAGGQELTSPAPVNIDLIRGGILLEVDEPKSDVDSIVLEFEQPPSGSGVTPGENLSVFLRGLYDTAPLEYRDAAMSAVSLPGAAGARNRLDLRFEVEDWFDVLEGFALTPTNGRIRLDSQNNTAAAGALENTISSSLTTFGDCEECEVEVEHD